MEWLRRFVDISRTPWRSDSGTTITIVECSNYIRFPTTLWATTAAKMSDQNTIRLLRVFLGSPGDLIAERRRAHQVVDEVNRTIARQVGIHVILVGWEDTLPGAGRPQELINIDVDQCNIFLGMLWKRWGTPPGGEDGFTSGFEEEFERASRRRRETSEPQIWLAFKKVDSESRGDPGPHLQRVLAFRTKQEQAREVLFKEFSDVDDWERQLREWLSTFVLQEGLRARNAITLTEQGTTVPIPEVPDSRKATEIGEAEEALPKELLELTTLLAQATQDGTTTYLARFFEASEFEVIRLALVSKAWLSSRFTNELLTTHELNTLYRYRESLRLLSPENELVHRSLIADTSDVVPGWYYFVNMDGSTLSRFLFQYVQDDSIPAVKLGAIELLELARLGPSTSDDRAALVLAIGSEEAMVSQAALDYLGAVGVTEDLSLLDAASIAEFVSKSQTAQNARARILIRANAEDPAVAIPSPLLGMNTALIEEIKGNAARLSAPALREGLSHGDRSIRRVAAEELIRRNAIEPEDLRRLLDDPSLRVREVALMRLLDLGEVSITPEIVRAKLATKSAGMLSGFGQERVNTDAVLAAAYKQLPNAQLEDARSWYQADGSIAYGQRALQLGDQGLSEVRSDIEDSFATRRHVSREAIRLKYGELAEPSLANYNRLDAFIEQNFRSAAIEVIAANGHAEDVRFARDELDRGGARLLENGLSAAIETLLQHGSPTDAENLIKLATSSYGRAKRRAADVAAALDEKGAVRTLLASDDPELVNAGFRAIWDKDWREHRATAEALLKSEKPDTRRAAIAYLIHHLDRASLQEILDGYISHGMYFYNVVCWLDRALCAPEPLRAPYLSRLRETVFRLSHSIFE